MTGHRAALLLAPLALLTAGCGLFTAAVSPPGAARQTVVLGSSRHTVTVYPPFVHGQVWWKSGSGSWSHASWTHLPATLPQPLRTTLGWLRALHQGSWPGPPLPSTWAAWAGHVGAPLGWVVFPEPANGGPPHPISILAIVPQTAPYHGYGKFFVLWTETRGHWQATVHGPVAEPSSAGSQLALLWHESTTSQTFSAQKGEHVVGQPLVINKRRTNKGGRAVLDTGNSSRNGRTAG